MQSPQASRSPTALLFGDPATIRQLAADIALPLPDDPDAARRLGQEFERQVLDGSGK